MWTSQGLNLGPPDYEVYRTETVAADVTKHTEEYNNVVAEQTALNAEADYIGEQLSALRPNVTILEEEKDKAQQAYENKQKELSIIENALALWREELEGVEEELATATTEADKLKAEYEGYWNQLMDLNKQINDLDDQLKGLEWNESIAEYNFRKAMWACDMAASNYIHLNNFYESVKAQRAYNWLSLKTDDNRYLMVDTAYLEDEPEESTYSHLKFGLKAYKAIEETHPGIAEMNKRDINGRFNFRFLYYPTQDSLHIEADGYNQKFVTTENWVDRSNWEINKIATPVLGMEQNLVKVVVLGNTREVTIGSSEYRQGTFPAEYTIHDCIGLNLVGQIEPGVIPNGLYFMDVNASEDSQRNNARLMVDLDGSLTLITPADQGKIKFEHMPAAKWVVENKPTYFGGYPDIFNEETGAPLNHYAYKVIEKEGKYYVSVTFDYQGQEIVEDFVMKEAPAYADGYYNAAPEKREVFSLGYLNVAGDLRVNVGGETLAGDTVLAVSNEDETKFALNLQEIETYGEADTLKRGIYTISVNDANKLALNKKYVQISNVDGTELMVVSEANTATKFYLKEVNHDNNHYYALINVAGDKKAGVVDATGIIKAEDITAETRTSAFALLADTTRYYREFTAEELGENNILKFYRTRSTEKEYLYAAAPVEDMTFLAVEDKGNDSGAAAEMTVIPTTEAGVLMPQYLIARNVVEKAGKAEWCEDTDHTTLADSLACIHTRITPDTLFGQFLVNLKVDAKYAKYDWEGKYTRLAFLDGYAVKDTKTYPVPGTGEYSKVFIDDKEVSAANKHDAVKFEFRLINDEEAQDFLIESESYKNNDAFGGEACPIENGGWLKVQNGVPVIINDNFENMDASSADIYNVDTNIVDDPTANEDITASSVTIIAGNGQITINGAAGKKVVVSNILGQVVANTVLTSDNATIAAPQGVVVVAVEGEEAVKAIVK